VHVCDKPYKGAFVQRMLNGWGCVNMKIKKTTIIAVVALIAVVSVASVYYYFNFYSVSPITNKQEIVIGAAVSQTGSYGAGGRLVIQGYQLWEAAVNAKGGILGKPVRLVLYDDKSDPTTTTTLYERLITVDKVDFVLGPFSSSCGFTAAQVAEAYKMVMIQPINNAMKLYNQSWTYNFLATLGGTTDIYMTQPIKWLKTLSPAVHTIVTVNTADTFARGLMSTLPALCSQYNLTILYSEEVATDVADLTMTVTKLKGYNPDVALILGTTPVESLFVRTAASLDFDPPVMYGAQSNQVDFWNVLNQTAVGVATTDVFNPSLLYPGVSEFVGACVQKFGHIPGAKEGCGYTTGQILEAAIEGTGSLDQNTIKDWLISNEVQTVIGPWKIDQTRATNENLRWVPALHSIMEQWNTQGLLQVVYPPDAATAQSIYPR